MAFVWTAASLAILHALLLCIAASAIGMGCANIGIKMSNKSSATAPPSSQNDVIQAVGAQDSANHQGRKLKEEYSVRDEQLSVPAAMDPANQVRKLKEEYSVRDKKLPVRAAKVPANQGRKLKEEYVVSDEQLPVPPIGFHSSSTYIPKPPIHGIRKAVGDDQLPVPVPPIGFHSSSTYIPKPPMHGSGKAVSDDQLPLPPVGFPSSSTYIPKSPMP